MAGKSATKDTVKLIRDEARGVEQKILTRGKPSMKFPLRALANVRTIIGKQVSVVTAAQVVAAYGAEGSDVAEVTPDPTPVEVKAERGGAFVRLTFELLADLPASVGEVGRLLTDAKDNLEAEKFAVGLGTNEPEGIVAGLTPFDAAPTAVADYIAAQDDLGARYQANARWLMPISEINEALTGEERLTHERHRSLDTRLVLR